MSEIFEKVKITLVQANTIWENKEANLEMLEDKILNTQLNTDLIVLPEMFNTGFSMSASRLAEPINSYTTTWLLKISKQLSCDVVGSLIISEENKYYNRLIWVKSNGEVKYYDKRHLFQMAGEDKVFSKGSEKVYIELKGWRFLPLICYDLRFPVWCRNVDLSYDCCLFVANWPSPRLGAWDNLLKARAIENSVYSIGVNRVGEDGIGVKYSGHSAVYNPKGDVEAFLGEEETISTITLSYNVLKNYRYKFPSHLDADSFSL